MDGMTHIEARQPNWLPLPGDESPGMHEAPAVEENDFFPKGVVESFFPEQGLGRLKNARGESIPFDLSQIEMIGPKAGKRYLQAGSRVGFDVSWTSSGLRVSKIRVY